MEIYLFFLVIIFCFSFVLLFGAPYVPTMKKQSEVALELLDLRKGQVLYELGCGDGRVLLKAKEMGLKSIGYELNPILYLIAKIRTFKARNEIEVRYGNFWTADLGNADGVYVFLFNKFMKKLDKKLSKELKKGAKLASYAFKIPDKKIIAENQAVFLYKY